MAYRHIFGPVISRRLGVSLGVDLVTHKVCSMDCIYCECGKTTRLTCERGEYVPFDRVIRELDLYFSTQPDPDYITFSGSGEPTLHSHLGDVIGHIKEKRPKVKVSVLTNASLIFDPAVRKALSCADLVVPSLDAVSQKTFKKINRSCAGVDVDKIVNGLIAFRKEFKGRIWLEVLILPGINDSEPDILALKQAVAKIRPDRVQLNTLDRPGTMSNLRPATRMELEKIIRILGSDRVQIVAKVDEKTRAGILRRDIQEAIIETVHRRPCTAEDLMNILGISAEETDKNLSALIKDKKIVQSRQKRGIFYQTVKGENQ